MFSSDIVFQWLLQEVTGIEPFVGQTFYLDGASYEVAELIDNAALIQPSRERAYA